MSKENYKEKVKNSPYAKLVNDTGLRLYELRSKKELTGSKLVAQLSSEKKEGTFVSISESQYSRFEKGENFMNSEVLMALCKFYDVSADYILFGEKPPQNSITNFFTKSNAPEFCCFLESEIKKIKECFDID